MATNNANTTDSSFNLKASYDGPNVGEALKKRRLKLTDSKLGAKDEENKPREEIVDQTGG